jgi:hypothetical protein
VKCEALRFICTPWPVLRVRRVLVLLKSERCFSTSALLGPPTTPKKDRHSELHMPPLWDQIKRRGATADKPAAGLTRPTLEDFARNAAQAAGGKGPSRDRIDGVWKGARPQPVGAVGRRFNFDEDSFLHPVRLLVARDGCSSTALTLADHGLG